MKTFSKLIVGTSSFSFIIFFLLGESKNWDIKTTLALMIIPVAFVWIIVMFFKYVEETF